MRICILNSEKENKNRKSTIKFFSVSYTGERLHLRVYEDSSMKDFIL